MMASSTSKPSEIMSEPNEILCSPMPQYCMAKNVMAKTSGYKGVTGTIGFDEKGDIKNGALTLFTYKGGKRDVITVVR